MTHDHDMEFAIRKVLQTLMLSVLITMIQQILKCSFHLLGDY